MKEFLYVGYYFDENGEFILKIGTTNNLERRKAEHTRNYRKSPEHKLPKDAVFNYLWALPLSKYNTLRYEDKNREIWQKQEIGEFIRNDRFLLHTRPDFVEITIKKTYKIPLV